MDNAQLEFNQVYRAAQPPEIRALMDMHNPEEVHVVNTSTTTSQPVSSGPPPTQDEINARAAALAQKGFTIDVPIMVWGWDPYLVMQLRQQFGYTWVPSALQPNVAVAPGLPGFGNLPPYDPNHPPPGSIKVSLNISDYPPFDPPMPVTPDPAANSDPVGLQTLGTLYLSVRGEAYPDGAKFTDSRGTFLKHVNINPFGRSSFWEKIS